MTGPVPGRGRTAQKRPPGEEARPGTPNTDQDLQRCNGPDCGRPIRWVITLAGARMPLDPDPSDDGNVIPVRDADGNMRARVLTGNELPAQVRAWVPHHRTCPNADAYKRRRHATVRRCYGCREPMDPALGDALYHPLCEPAPPQRARPGPADSGPGQDTIPDL